MKLDSEFKIYTNIFFYLLITVSLKLIGKEVERHILKNDNVKSIQNLEIELENVRYETPTYN